MKRTLGSTLAAIVLTITTLTIPAQAYTMEADGFTITPNQETLDFWTQHKYPLNDRGSMSTPPTTGTSALSSMTGCCSSRTPFPPRNMPPGTTMWTKTARSMT